MLQLLRVLIRVFALLGACLLLEAPLAAQPAQQPAQPTRPATAAAQSKDITLNFKDADIRQIIEAVAEATGKNFIVDSRVKGPVTLRSDGRAGAN